jgi:16S rRNA (adenine1518-N6/adenine1519-N6)-dimethyltransferase
VIPKISELLKAHQLSPSKKLGQNFLLDSNVTDKIVRYVPNIKDAVVLEIGAGPGALTRSLLSSSAKMIFALEFDRKLITLLELLQTQFPDKMQVIESDAIYFQEEIIAQGGKITLVGNLPYNISVPLLFKWLDKSHLFNSLTLMFQKEVADRIIAKPNSKSYGNLSVLAQFSSNVFHGFDISPTAFFPPPKVTSSVITVVPKPRDEYSMELYPVLKKICHAAFNQRRKTISNSLSAITYCAKEILKNADIDDGLRAENLSVDQFVRLTEEYIKSQE